MIRVTMLMVVLVGCEPSKQIGENDPDAAMLITMDVAFDGPGVTCNCGPASCGTRICGRSDCGFPCGECEPSEFCFVGTQCQAGVGPGTACVDAFGDRVWEGDRGLRACPTDATLQQECTCTGGGPTAWASCDPTCIEVCTHVPTSLTCGAPGCGAGDVCCIPTGNTNTRACTTGTCPVSNYTRTCDGPEDCNAGSVCCGGDNPWTAQCVPGTTCSPLDQFCHSGSDCGSAKPFCCPGPVEDMRACSAIASAGCN